MKKLLNQNVSGQIAVPFIIGIVIAAVTGTFTAVTYVQSQVQPLQADYAQQQTAIAQVNVNLEWIKSALESKGIVPNQIPNQNGN